MIGPSVSCHWLQRVIINTGRCKVFPLTCEQGNTPESFWKIALLGLNYLSLYLFIYLFIFVFLGPHPRHMEVPRLGVKSEPQLRAYTTATAIAMGSQAETVTCPTAHHNARSLTHWARLGIELTSSWRLAGFANHWATTGTPPFSLDVSTLNAENT